MKPNALAQGIPVLRANLYTAEALREIARNHDFYTFDEEQQCLLYSGPIEIHFPTPPKTSVRALRGAGSGWMMVEMTMERCTTCQTNPAGFGRAHRLCHDCWTAIKMKTVNENGEV